MTQQNTATPFIAMLLFLAVAGALSLKPGNAAAKAARSCTNQPQAGIAHVQLDEHGHSLTLVPLTVPFCGLYSVVITPQGSESAAAEDMQALFDIERYFVDTHNLDAFVIGAKGEPNAAAYFQWIAHPRTQ